jgi:NDP-sugar pyrophosphorylase family protein
MVEIKGKPFLDILIDYVANFGFRRFILCTGYLSNVIKKYFQNKKKDNLEIIFSRERGPLGTGGAIRNAKSLIKRFPFLVMNGDSFCEIDLAEFIRFHKRKKSLISIALSKVSDENNDYGKVALDDSGKIIGFAEKMASGYVEKLVNAGIYLFEKAAFSKMPRRINFSLEYDFFPRMANRRLYGYKTKGLCVDIGTEQRYKRANQILRLKK